MRASSKRFSKIMFLAMLMAAFGRVGAADSRAASLGQIMPADKLFLENAAYADMTEMKAGQLAQQKGTTDAIKEYGKKLVDDHAEIDGKLKALAASKSVMLPTKPDAQHQAIIATLAKCRGAEFDSAFVTAMKHGHDNAIAQFDRAKASKDTDIADFAGKTVVMLLEHVEAIPNAAPTKP